MYLCKGVCYLADTDKIIERATGKSIAQIFAEDGEAAFRRAEQRLLRVLQNLKLNENDVLIIACGGGMFSKVKE